MQGKPSIEDPLIHKEGHPLQSCSYAKKLFFVKQHNGLPCICAVVLAGGGVLLRFPATSTNLVNVERLIPLCVFSSKQTQAAVTVLTLNRACRKTCTPVYVLQRKDSHCSHSTHPEQSLLKDLCPCVCSPVNRLRLQPQYSP